MGVDVTLLGFVAVLGGTSLLAFAAGRSRGRDGVPTLEAWALADRRYGAFAVWLLLGGTIYTAYTFAAVPGLVYGAGAIGFFALPYTIVVYPLAFWMLPRLWSVSAEHGFITVADYARGRWGSHPLALAIALTGLLATMPYVALQLLGIRAVLRGRRHLSRTGPPATPCSHWCSGCWPWRRTAAACAHPRSSPWSSARSWSSVAVGVSLAALDRLGGPGARLRRWASPSQRRRPPPSPRRWTPRCTWRTRPWRSGRRWRCSSTRTCSPLRSVPARRGRCVAVWSPCRCGPPCSRCSACWAWPRAARVSRLRWATPRRPLPMFVADLLPALLTGLVFGALAVGALVPAAVMSVAAGTLFARNIYSEYLHPEATPRTQTRVARVTSLVVKVGALFFVFGLRGQDAINLQLLGGVWILQTFPAVALGLCTRWLHRGGILAGWATGMAVGTYLVAEGGFSALVDVGVGGAQTQVYAAVVALVRQPGGRGGAHPAARPARGLPGSGCHRLARDPRATVSIWGGKGEPHDRHRAADRTDRSTGREPPRRVPRVTADGGSQPALAPWHRPSTCGTPNAKPRSPGSSTSPMRSWCGSPYCSGPGRTPRTSWRRRSASSTGAGPSCAHPTRRRPTCGARS